MAFPPLLSASLSQEFYTGSSVFINPVHCIELLRSQENLCIRVWTAGCEFRLPTLLLTGCVRFWAAHHSSEQQLPTIVTAWEQ